MGERLESRQDMVAYLKNLLSQNGFVWELRGTMFYCSRRTPEGEILYATVIFCPTCGRIYRIDYLCEGIIATFRKSLNPVHKIPSEEPFFQWLTGLASESGVTPEARQILMILAEPIAEKNRQDAEEKTALPLPS